MPTDYYVIQALVTFELRMPWVGTTLVSVNLTYDTRDPYAVTFAPRDDFAGTQWLLGRDLLCEGMFADTGDGDVRVTPTPDGSAVVVELNSPDGAAMMQTSTSELAAFLDRTYQVVPVGEESRWFDFDQELAKLA